MLSLQTVEAPLGLDPITYTLLILTVANHKKPNVDLYLIPNNIILESQRKMLEKAHSLTFEIADLNHPVSRILLLIDNSWSKYKKDNIYTEKDLPITNSFITDVYECKWII